jgi:ABC-type tungstate transport system substrate-binding protein
MRNLFRLAAILGMLVLTGCAHDRATVSPTSPQAGSGAVSTNAPAPEFRLIVTPETGLNGKVILANLSLRFVVLSFTVGQMPAVDQRMNVYRRELKVGEVKVNAKSLDENVTADIVAGEAAVGDAVRDK